MCNDKMLQQMRKVKVVIIRNNFQENLKSVCAVTTFSFHFVKKENLQIQIISKRKKSTKTDLNIMASTSEKSSVLDRGIKPLNSKNSKNFECDNNPRIFGKIYHSKLLSVLIHRTALNLKENLILPQEENSVQKRQCDSSLVKKNVIHQSTLSQKQHFHLKFLMKYQHPPDKEALKLLGEFPNPVKLFIDVVKPLVEGDPTLQPSLIVTSCLKSTYWKAQLIFNFENKITVTGIHHSKTQAIKRAFLLMCSWLKEIGLIYKTDTNQWCPVSCSKVVLMLETLSEYGSACLGKSKGHGFKIILEQIKTKGENTESFQSADINFSQETDCNVVSEDSKSLRKPFCASFSDHSSGLILSRDICNFLQCIDEDRNEKSDFLIEVVKSLLKADRTYWAQGTDCKLQNRAFWTCSVHVGWPFPFTVVASALSLPTSQLMGYMLTCMKLKKMRLLTPDNHGVNKEGIGGLVIRDTQMQWILQTSNVQNQDVMTKFNADITLYCDASRNGFGAYLIRGKHVNWLSEKWFHYSTEKNYEMPECSLALSTTLGELYCVVVAICSWKRKLRGRRILCYCDNKTVVCFVNTLATNLTVVPEYTSSSSSFDQLVQILQQTCINHNIKLQMSWINREDNWLADKLSRQDFESFLAHVPQAAPNKSKSIKIQIKDQILLWEAKDQYNS
ncbi:hypothetical protein BgiMline_011366 [Biomphalaria glabrata]|nr:CAunnamed protein product [Biomphalaria glabrata]